MGHERGRKGGREVYWTGVALMMATGQRDAIRHGLAAAAVSLSLSIRHRRRHYHHHHFITRRTYPSINELYRSPASPPCTISSCISSLEPTLPPRVMLNAGRYRIDLTQGRDSCTTGLSV